MAVMERPKLLARCKCGEMLIQYGGDDSYWTRSASIEMLFSGTGAETAECPGHGGDPRIKVGGGYHPRFMQEVAA